MASEHLKLFGELFSRANRTDYLPIIVVEGRGAKVRDSGGNQYIDLSASGAVMVLGYGNDELRKEIKRQVDKLIHYTYMYGMNEPALRLGEELLKISDIDEGKVLYGLSGTDAVESSLILAKAYTKRELILSYNGGFHGVFPLSADASCINLERKVCELIRCSKETICLPYPDTYRCSILRGDKDCKKMSLEILKETLEDLSKANKLPAALIAEPIQGDSGIVVPPEGYFREVARILRSYGIPLIIDEIQTGLGRTGEWFAYQYEGIKPDVVTLGKPLGGGLPISAVVGESKLMDSVPTMGLAFSLSGNPVTATAALTVINEIRKNKLLKKTKELGNYVIRELRSFMKKHELVGDVRGKGLMIGVELVKNKETKERAKNETKKVIYRAYELGAIVLSVRENVLRIQPPLTINKEELIEGINILEEAIEDVEEGKVNDEALKIVRGW